MRQHTSVSTVLEDGSVSVASPPAKADQKLRGASPTSFKDCYRYRNSSGAVNEVTASREFLPVGAARQSSATYQQLRLLQQRNKRTLVTRKRSMFNQNQTGDIDGDVLLSDDERQDVISEAGGGNEDEEYGASRVHKCHQKRALKDLDDTESVIQHILQQETNHPGSSRAKR